MSNAHNAANFNHQIQTPDSIVDFDMDGFIELPVADNDPNLGIVREGALLEVVEPKSADLENVSDIDAHRLSKLLEEGELPSPMRQSRYIKQGTYEADAAPAKGMERPKHRLHARASAFLLRKASGDPRIIERSQDALSYTRTHVGINTRKRPGYLFRPRPTTTEQFVTSASRQNRISKQLGQTKHQKRDRFPQHK